MEEELWVTTQHASLQNRHRLERRGATSRLGRVNNARDILSILLASARTPWDGQVNWGAGRGAGRTTDWVTHGGAFR